MAKIELENPVIWKEQVVLVVEAAPTGGFYGNLDFPDKRLGENLKE